MEIDTERFRQYAANFNSVRDFRELYKLFNNKTIDNRTIENTKTVQIFTRMLQAGDRRLVLDLTKDTELYRCRRLPLMKEKLGNLLSYEESTNILRGLDRFDSKEPPISIAGDGRCNIRGASYLYLAEDEHTACAEICPNNYDILSLAKFKIKQNMRIFDLTVDDRFDKYNDSKDLFSPTETLSQIMQCFYTPVYDENGYSMSQYFSDLIRKYGFNGVRYLSSKTMCRNYTIFTCGENFVEFVNSEPVRNHITKLDLYRINDASKIEPKIDVKFSEFTEADAKKLKENLIAEIRRESNQQAAITG